VDFFNIISLYANYLLYFSLRKAPGKIPEA
jgi:hypothetical protein